MPRALARRLAEPQTGPIAPRRAARQRHSADGLRGHAQRRCCRDLGRDMSGVGHRGQRAGVLAGQATEADREADRPGRDGGERPSEGAAWAREDRGAFGATTWPLAPAEERGGRPGQIFRFAGRLIAWLFGVIGDRVGGGLVLRRDAVGGGRELNQGAGRVEQQDQDRAGDPNPSRHAQLSRNAPDHLRALKVQPGSASNPGPHRAGRRLILSDWPGRGNRGCGNGNTTRACFPPSRGTRTDRVGSSPCAAIIRIPVPGPRLPVCELARADGFRFGEPPRGEQEDGQMNRSPVPISNWPEPGKRDKTGETGHKSFNATMIPVRPIIPRSGGSPFEYLDSPGIGRVPSAGPRVGPDPPDRPAPPRAQDARPVLHRKETSPLTDDPRSARVDRPTRPEEQSGLLDAAATTGTRVGWADRLRGRGYALRGRRLVRCRAETGG
jgi:hypothetical protein